MHILLTISMTSSGPCPQLLCNVCLFCVCNINNVYECAIKRERGLNVPCTFTMYAIFSAVIHFCDCDSSGGSYICVICSDDSHYVLITWYNTVIIPGE